MTAPALIHLPSNDALAGLVRHVTDVVYSTEQGRPLTMNVLAPWGLDEDDVEVPARPLVVYVQGSGWTNPDLGFETPQLAWLARSGYVVATLTHRSCTEEDHAPAPSFLQDVKTAIRYLRAHAGNWAIDPERVAIFGSSSGGNTAELVGVTGDAPQFRTSEWAGQSDAVSAVVACFGPCDMERFIDEHRIVAGDEFGYLLTDLCRADSEDPEAWREVARAISPVRYVTPETGPGLPPFLLGLGSEDPWMPEWTLTAMHERLSECGASSTGVIVEGAVHEKNFWSQAFLDMVRDFLDEHLHVERRPTASGRPSPL